MAPALAAFEQALTTLREAHAGETSTLRAALDQAQAEAAEARQRADELQAGQALMVDMHHRELAEAREQFERLREAAEDEKDLLNILD